MKAYYVKVTKEISPKTHNLLYLAEQMNLVLNEEQEIFLGILMKYQLEGRYPDYDPIIPSSEKALQYIVETNNLLQWFKKKL